MPLTAEFRLESYQLPLVDIVATVPELILQLVHGEQPESELFVFFIRATGFSFDGLESKLNHSPWIQNYIVLSRRMRYESTNS